MGKFTNYNGALEDVAKLKKEKRELKKRVIELEEVVNGWSKAYLLLLKENRELREMVNNYRKIYS